MMTTRARRLVVVVLALVALGSVAPAEELPPPLTLTGTVERVGGRAGGTATMQVQIRIDRWINKDEALGFYRTLESGGQAALVASLRTQIFGALDFGAGIGPKLRWARSRQLDRGRQVVLAFDRPIDVYETITAQDSVNYPLSVAVLELDEDDRGEGTLFVRASIHVTADGGVEVLNYEEEASSIRNVEPKR
jgi:hypothetical protein